MKRCAVLLPLFMGVLLVACQTPKKPEAPPPPEAHVLFEPGWSVSPIQMGQGRYPDLLAGACRGVWVDSTVTELKRASAPPVDGFAVHGDTTVASAHRLGLERLRRYGALCPSPETASRSPVSFRGGGTIDREQEQA